MAANANPEETDAAGGGGAPLMTSFDLETYIGRYNATSETRLQRLLFIGEKSTDPAVSSLAYKLAEQQMKQTGNVRRYKEVFAPRLESETMRKTGVTYDPKWADDTETTGHSQLDMLEGRLSAAQSQLNKEAIRAAFLALGEFCRKRGELREALRAVLRSRDYCTSRAQTGHVCLLVIEMAIDCREYNRVRDYVAKAEHINIEGDIHFPYKPRAAAGLVYLAEGRYQEAAQKFTSVSGPLLDSFDTVMSTEDVALYGALLALATMSRSELCSMLEPPSTTMASTDTSVDGKSLGSFAAGLELVPPIRDALRHFSRAEYKLCLDVLQQLKPQLLLDLHLSSHVNTLLDKIRDKCLVEYLAPYRRVRLDVMCLNFGLSTEQLQSILAGLIKKGSVANARIDCRTHTLTKESDLDLQQQRSARRRVSQLEENVLNDAHAMLVRMACLEHDLVVRGEKRGESRSNWGNRPGPEAGGAFEEVYDLDESSEDGDTSMVDIYAMNPEDLY